MKRKFSNLAIGSSVMIGNFDGKPIEWIKVDEKILVSKFALFNSQYFSSRNNLDARVVGDDAFFVSSDLFHSLGEKLKFSDGEAQAIYDLRLPRSYELKKTGNTDLRLKYFKKNSSSAISLDGYPVSYWCMDTGGMANYAYVITYNGQMKSRWAIGSTFGGMYAVRPLIEVDGNTKIELKGEYYVLENFETTPCLEVPPEEQENENRVSLNEFLGLW